MSAPGGHSDAPPDGIVHATAVARDGRAVLITGPAGSGKTTLALRLMALGAGLICDDRVRLHAEGGTLIAGPAPNIAGLIEVRGVGILRADPAPPNPVRLVVDLDRDESERLPPWRTVRMMGVDLPCLHKIEGPHFPAAILQYLKHGRAE